MIADAWNEALSKSDDKSALIIILNDIIDMLKGSNDGISESFQGITDSVQSVINTMVELIVSGLLKQPKEDLETHKVNTSKII